MKSKTIPWFLACFLMVGPLAAAEPLRTKKHALALTDAVVSEVAAGELERGLRLMAPYAIVPESEFEVAIEQARIQFPSLLARVGNPIGHEFICEKEAGQSFYKVIQVVKYEKHMVRFRFVFYKPKDYWVLNTYYFDDRIEALFCE